MESLGLGHRSEDAPRRLTKTLSKNWPWCQSEPREPLTDSAATGSYAVRDARSLQTAYGRQGSSRLEAQVEHGQPCCWG